MNNSIDLALQELRELLKQSGINSRSHNPDTIWGASSGKLFKAWACTYQRWMDLRANAGNAFALSLGYGQKDPA